MNEDTLKRAMREMGRRGGKKGGPARQAQLTKEQQSELGKKAIAARWAKRKQAQ